MNELERREGFSASDVTSVLCIVFLLLMSAGYGFQFSLEAQAQSTEDQVLVAQAKALLDRVVAQPFGERTMTVPSDEELLQLLSLSEEPSSVSLSQLAGHQPRGGWIIRGAHLLSGEWRLWVDHDLDGDGVVAGEAEHHDDLLRVAIVHGDRVLLDTVCTRKESR